MERYKLMEQLGDGTYGCVVKGRNRETGEVVAIKRMKRKFNGWNECVTLREIESLRTLSSHPHIVQVHEVIRESDSALYFVFEFMPDGNLYELIKRCTPRRNLSNGQGGDGRTTSRPAQTLTQSRIRSIIFQVLLGLEHMHSRGYFHRDIKPENLLLRGDVCKVADFGLAREVRSLPPYTDYVSTRWYRAPEVLLRSPRYGTPIDAFAVGCVLAELTSLRPLFPGRSELDQIGRLVSVLGRPTEETWPEGMRLAGRMGLHFPATAAEGSAAAGEVRRREAKRKGNKRGSGDQARNEGVQSVVVHTPLERMVPKAPPEALRLMRDLLKWDPKARPGPAASLRYPYFSDGSPVPDSTTKGGNGRRQQTESSTDGETAVLKRDGGKNGIPSGVKRKSPDDGDLPAAGSDPKKKHHAASSDCRSDIGSLGRSQFAPPEARVNQPQQVGLSVAATVPMIHNAGFGMPQYPRPQPPVGVDAAAQSFLPTGVNAGHPFGAPQFGAANAPGDPAGLAAGTKTPALATESALAAFASLGRVSNARERGDELELDFMGGESAQNQLRDDLNASGGRGGMDDYLGNLSATRQHHHGGYPGSDERNRDPNPCETNPFDANAQNASLYQQSQQQPIHLTTGAFCGDAQYPFQGESNDRHSHEHSGGGGGGPFARAGLRAMQATALPPTSNVGEPRTNSNPLYKSGSPMSLYVGGGLNQYAPPAGFSPGIRPPRRALGGGVLNPYKSPKSSGRGNPRGLGGPSSHHRSPPSGFGRFNFP